MLSRLGEQRYAPSQESWAVEGDAAGGATWGEPPALCVDTGPLVDSGALCPQL